MPAALELARRYAEALTALRAVHRFDAWLGAYWHDRCPAPTASPTARTSVGVAGSIAWYEAADTVVGYLPGDEGCFRIPRAEVLPEFPATAAGLSLAFGQDMVISAAMRDELQAPER